MTKRATGKYCSSCGAGLRPVCLGRNYVEEGDLLEVPAKRRRSPRPASHNVALLSASPHPSSQLNPGPVLPIFPFAPVGVTEIVFLPNFRTRGLGTLNPWSDTGVDTSLLSRSVWPRPQGTCDNNRLTPGKEGAALYHRVNLRESFYWFQKRGQPPRPLQRSNSAIQKGTVAAARVLK